MRLEVDNTNDPHKKSSVFDFFGRHSINILLGLLIRNTLYVALGVQVCMCVCVCVCIKTYSDFQVIVRICVCVLIEC